MPLRSQVPTHYTDWPQILTTLYSGALGDLHLNGYRPNALIGIHRSRIHLVLRDSGKCLMSNVTSNCLLTVNLRSQSSKPLNLPMSPFELVGLLPAKTGLFADQMTSNSAYTTTTLPRRLPRLRPTQTISVRLLFIPPNLSFLQPPMT